MIDVKVQNNDIVIEDGDIVWVDKAQALRQKLEIKLLHLSGEWYLNTSQGIGYILEFGKKRPNLNTITAQIKAAITEEEEVRRVNKFQLDYDAKQRTINVNIQIESIYGTIQL